MSKKSTAVQKDEGVKFKLVEDIRLVTIPITTCLFVLLSYIIFGAIHSCFLGGTNEYKAGITLYIMSRTGLISMVHISVSLA